MDKSNLIPVMVMCSLALHPTNKTQHKEIFSFFASADCLPLQNLTQADQHFYTKRYAVKVPRILYLFARWR